VLKIQNAFILYYVQGKVIQGDDAPPIPTKSMQHIGLGLTAAGTHAWCAVPRYNVSVLAREKNS